MCTEELSSIADARVALAEKAVRPSTRRFDLSLVQIALKRAEGADVNRNRFLTRRYTTT
jgi:hypothetical protein